MLRATEETQLQNERNMKRTSPMGRSFAHFETLEVRTALDGSGLCACPIEFEDSQFVTELDDGTLRFASLNVGTTSRSVSEPDQILEDDETILVGDYPITVGQTKEFLHGFADTLGTDLFAETLDLRWSTWGTGSGSTSKRFEEFIVEQLEAQQPCTGLQFSGPVRFELPGEGGEFFTGGFLEIDANGRGGILRGGDIVQVVEGYEIEATPLQTTLTVRGELLGEVSFVINNDFTLTDEFDQVWHPDSDEYQIVAPKAVDELLGDLDGDGTVAFADFLMLADNIGKESATGDLDGDGVVAFVDFLILSNNFGNTLE
jgi:hypothetical protein